MTRNIRNASGRNSRRTSRALIAVCERHSVGSSTPELKNAKALAGVVQRDYSYDLFWVVFPLINDKGILLFSDSVREVELLVGIYDKEGIVAWSIPDSIRERARALNQQK